MSKCFRHLVVVVVVASHFREMNLSQAKRRREMNNSLYINWYTSSLLWTNFRKPQQDSMLTRLLAESFGGSSKTFGKLKGCHADMRPGMERLAKNCLFLKNILFAKVLPANSPSKEKHWRSLLWFLCAKILENPAAQQQVTFFRISSPHLDSLSRAAIRLPPFSVSFGIKG